MTPKEKAKDLINKFGTYAPMVVDEVLYSNPTKYITREYVDHKGNGIGEHYGEYKSDYLFWQEVKQEVKQEIEKL